ncbi:hypothetical protein [Nocardiopsis kunsanensis]|uniref:hypothetical protein n=1 Tax=Nocardiopsis kunsanensis TaxID=141693 RepID=UPI000345A779|nr:hypothetical protein [Nocardiopsis kunsanensis]
MRPAHGTLHLLRTAFLAGASTGIAYGGHNLWAPEPASTGGFLAATAFLFPVLLFFTRSLRGMGDIFAVLAASQTGIHLILQSSGGPDHGLLLHGAQHSGHGLLAHVLGFAPGMLIAHLWAALLAAALLAHGEAALWALASLLTRWLPRGPRPRVPVVPRPVALPLSPGLPPSPVDLSTHGPRGPPGQVLPCAEPDPAHAVRP